MEEETAQEMEQKRLTYSSVARGSDLNPYSYVIFFLIRDNAQNKCEGVDHLYIIFICLVS